MRKSRDALTKEERKEQFRNFKKPLLVERGFCCQLCGHYQKSGLQTHHVLPYARFPDLAFEKRNILVVCEKCHNEIHTNPFLEARLIRLKAKELGIDLTEIYGFKQKGNGRKAKV